METNGKTSKCGQGSREKSYDDKNRSDATGGCISNAKRSAPRPDMCPAGNMMMMMMRRRRRMACPCRYYDQILCFGRPVPVLSMICNHVIDFIFDSYLHRISRWNPQLLDPASLQMYCDTIFRKGAPLNNCFGFIDGAVRPVCRPGEQQRVLWNGHKRVHALKPQSVVLPSVRIAHMYGPVGNMK